jgi:hypothetical protein
MPSEVKYRQNVLTAGNTPTRSTPQTIASVRTYVKCPRR